MNANLRTILLYTSLAVLVVALYWSTFRTMGQLWTLTAYQYGFIVPPIAAYLLWRRRDLLAIAPLRPAAFGLVTLPALVAAWLVARSSAIQIVEHFAVLAMIPTAALAAGGWAAFRVAAFPLLFVLAALPVGDGLIPQLMVIAAHIADALLNLFGIPAYRQGQVFVLSGGSFEVADVCSGLMYLLAGTVVSILFAQINYRKTWKRIAFVVCAAVLFVVANGVRAFIVMAVASATEMRWLAGKDHVYFGHAMFAVLILALFWFAARFADPEPEVTMEAARLPAMPSRIPIVGWGLVAALLALGPIMAAQRDSQASVAGPEVTLPALSGCEGLANWALDWKPLMGGPDVEASGSYACATSRVHVYLATYRTQAQGRELIADGNQLVDKRIAAYLERGRGEFRDAAGEAVRIYTLYGRPSGTELAIGYWYSVNGRPAFSSVEVKLREAIAAVTGQPASSTVHMVIVEARDTSTTNARERLGQATAEAWQHYQRAESWRVDH